MRNGSGDNFAVGHPTSCSFQRIRAVVVGAGDEGFPPRTWHAHAHSVTGNLPQAGRECTDPSARRAATGEGGWISRPR